jgi:serine/threonine-protein kinase
MTRTGAVMGTPYYMAPEQAKGSRQLDHRVDLYAVGVVLYEALTGKVPFDAETFNELLFKIVLETPRPVEEMAPGIDPNLCAIVRRAMAREPNERFQSAEEFRAALDRWAASAGMQPEASGRYSQVSLQQRGSAPNLALTPGNWTDAPAELLTAKPNRTSLYLATATIVLVVFGAGGFLLISGRRTNAEAAAAAAAASASAMAAQAQAQAQARAQAQPPEPPPPLPSSPSVDVAPPPTASAEPLPSAKPAAVSTRPTAPRRPTHQTTARPEPAPRPEPTAQPARPSKGSGRPIRTEL